MTIVLVTHFMEEAERLCDRVALIDQGRVVATDTPQGLARQVSGSKQVTFEPSGPFDDQLLLRLPQVTAVARHGHRVQVSGSGDLVNAVILTLDKAGLSAHDVELSATSLEDAFVALTGRGLASFPPQPGPQRKHRERTARPGTNGQAGNERPGRERTARPGMRTARRPSSILPGATPRRAFAKLTASEARLAWRQPTGLLVGLGLPVLLLVIFGFLPAFHHHRSSLGGLSYFDVYVPTLVALVIAALGFFGLPTPLATYREQGILRRLSTTPVPPAWVLGAQLVVQVVIAAVALVTLMVAGTAGFGLQIPASIGGFALAAVLSIAAVFAIGLSITGIAPSAVAAGGIGWATFFPLMFFAGLWVPVQEFPAALRDVSDYTPLRASVEALQHAVQTGFPTAAPLLVLAAYPALFGWLALRYFRWE